MMEFEVVRIIDIASRNVEVIDFDDFEFIIVEYLFLRQLEGRGSPTIREMVNDLGETSPQPLFNSIKKLVKDNVLTKEPGKARTIRLNMDAIIPFIDYSIFE